MTPLTEPVVVTRASERGTALIGVLLLLMMMSALAAALGVSGQTETFISRNQRAGMQAQAAAEAGLNHAVQVATDYIFEWKSHNCGGGGGVDAGVAAAVNTLLAGPGATSCDTPAGAMDDSLNEFLVAMGIPADTRLEIAAGMEAEYEVVITDDDASAGAAEDGNLANDVNGLVVVRAEGYGQDGTKVVVEALISPLELPAVVTNGDLTLSGNVTITGPASETSVHSNAGLTFDGTSSNITGNVSASGELNCDDPCDNVTGTTTEGATELPVPAVNASDYLVWADFILTDAGTMTDASGAVLCTWDSKTSCNNWNWNVATGGWVLSDSTVTAGTYYVQGDATISGSPGSKASPALISIIAEGSIDISGSPKLAPDTPELLFVTDQDLKIAGTLDLIGESVQVEGQMLVGGQVDIGGNAALDGQLIVENKDVGSLVASNHIHGNASITYSGTLGTGTYSVSSWRDVRDAD